MDRRTLLIGLPAALMSSTGQAEPSKALKLVAAAREQTRHRVTYDGSYSRMAYPNGDVAPDKGVCTDVVIRAYRAAFGIDLQQRVHEDMKAHFALYPNTWGLTRPDSHIDHRRVPNLEVFFRRHATVLSKSRHPSDYQPGDLVTYRLPFGQPHIAIVSDKRAWMSSDRYLVIHNIGAGPKEEDALLSYNVTGHFRYAV